MKKIFSFTIVLMLVFSLLSACSNDDRSSRRKNADDSSDKSYIDFFDNGDNTFAPSDVDCSNISWLTDFSNGRAFVKYNDDNNIYCIDKKGKHLFTLQDCTLGYFDKFNGKISMHGKKSTDEYFFCDKNGKVYEAADFGASRFILKYDEHKEAFMDGYIFLERREESYTGTVTEMSIIDSDFKTLVPFSVELADKINDILDGSGEGYYDGYLYNDDTIMDLRTGMLLTDRTQMKVSAPLLEYCQNNSYDKNLKKGDIYDAITYKVIAKADESELISDIWFRKDLGLARYYSDNGDWFSIIGSDGIAKFSPIKQLQIIDFDGEIILTYGYTTVRRDNKEIGVLIIRTYDVSGNLLGEMEIEGVRGTTSSVSLSDGVIVVGISHSSDNKEYMILDSKLKNLF